MPEAGRGAPASGELPRWAVWNDAAAAHPWTVGVEEEVMLLDARRWSLANRIDDVLAVLADDVRARASAETHACVLELKTAPHETAAEVADDLAALRHGLDAGLATLLGLRAAAAGTHPLATRSDVAVSSGTHYREVGTTMRALARREPTMALHVPVAVPDGATAVRALDGLRRALPVLLALSANSPYWRATDSGFASIRTPVFSMFPRVGIPRHFGTYDQYVRTVEPMLSSGAIPEPGFLWWDARLRPRLGTVEVRIMDAQSGVADAAALAAVVHCLVRRHAQRDCAAGTAPELLEENRFLAARDGVQAKLIDVRTQRRRPLREALDELLTDCAPFADGLDCTAELATAAALSADTGYE